MLFVLIFAAVFVISNESFEWMDSDKMCMLMSCFKCENGTKTKRCLLERVRVCVCVNTTPIWQHIVDCVDVGENITNNWIWCDLILLWKKYRWSGRGDTERQMCIHHTSEWAIQTSIWTSIIFGLT